MSRRTWWAVGLVAATLVLGSGVELPRLPSPPAMRLPTLARPSLPAVALPALPPGSLVALTAMLGGVLALLAVRRRRRDRVSTAQVLARRGCPPEQIARDTRLSRDALRLLLLRGRG